MLVTLSSAPFDPWQVLQNYQTTQSELAEKHVPGALSGDDRKTVGANHPTSE
jgi:hypothetical protein